jgi:hypothetical protein
LAANKISVITKNGITRLTAPEVDISKLKSDKKITDEEILAILEQPLNKSQGKTKTKKKKTKKPAAAAKPADDDESSSEDE